MDALQKQYADLQAQYRGALQAASVESNETAMDEHARKLLELNRQMSGVAQQMMDRVAQYESQVNMDDLRKQLSDELTTIQQDTQSIQAGRDRRAVFKSILEHTRTQATRASTWVSGYILAILAAIVLILLTMISSVFAGMFAEPPTAPIAPMITQTV